MRQRAHEPACGGQVAPGFALACGVLCAVLSPACGGQTDTLGTSAWLRVPGATFVAGPLPDAGGGPSVVAASITRTEVYPGLGDRRVEGSVASSVTGLALALEGDSGHWLLPAGPPDVQVPDALTLSAPVAFARTLPLGPRTLLVQAVDARGHAGPPFPIALQAEPITQTDAALAFTLTWDTEADLDLHVVAPDGAEVYWNHIAAAGGLLDFDSNQSCALDGLRAERISWTSAPPAGHYLVRVDTPSLCGEATARWTLTATESGVVSGQSRGQSIPIDTQGPHARGAGLLALELDVP